MNIEKIKIGDLFPIKDNVRIHNEKQIDELIKSLNQFGQTRAIIIDENNTILIGNGLYEAMKKRGDSECECSRITGLSEKDKKKLVLSDNKIFSLGLDDYENIQKYIDDIVGSGDFEVAGFDEEVLRQMAKEVEEIDTDVMKQGIVEQFSPSPSEPKKEPELPRETDSQETKTHSESIPEPSAKEKEPERNYVICPNCGEVIYLD